AVLAVLGGRRRLAGRPRRPEQDALAAPARARPREKDQRGSIRLAPSENAFARVPAGWLSGCGLELLSLSRGRRGARGCAFLREGVAAFGGTSVSRVCVESLAMA